MDGVREASHHTIVFQARAGTPELNCCSVNGPRGLGMLSEWAVLRSDEGLAVNYYGPMRVEWRGDDGARWRLTQTTRYPLEGQVCLRIEPDRPRPLAIRLRIPAWAQGARIRGPGGMQVAARPGKYAVVRRVSAPGDEIHLDLDLPLRVESGDLEMAGRVSVYRGPLLLAYDQRLNDFDEKAIPPLARLRPGARQSFTACCQSRRRADRPVCAWLVVEVPSESGPPLRPVRLCLGRIHRQPLRVLAPRAGPAAARAGSVHSGRRPARSAGSRRFLLAAAGIVRHGANPSHHRRARRR